MGTPNVKLVSDIRVVFRIPKLYITKPNVYRLNMSNHG